MTLLSLLGNIFINATSLLFTMNIVKMLFKDMYYEMCNVFDEVEIFFLAVTALVFSSKKKRRKFSKR